MVALGRGSRRRYYGRRALRGLVDGWRDFFRQQGVSARDLDMLAQYIDGSSLARQRKAL